MRTVEDAGAGLGSRRARLARDIRVLRRIAGLLWAYGVTGASVRRRYRRAQREGDVFLVDEEIPR